jgi:DNA gyrase/topoisomerase IV subunit B
MLKIYIDSIIPSDHIRSIVNIGIDVVVNTKIINVKVPDEQINVIVDEVDGIPVRIQSKSRVSILSKAVLSLLNGAEVAGVGKMIFSR